MPEYVERAEFEQRLAALTAIVGQQTCEALPYRTLALALAATHPNPQILAGVFAGLIGPSSDPLLFSTATDEQLKQVAKSNEELLATLRRIVRLPELPPE